MASFCLPRLIYVSNVPVECSYHGSALIYRLLHDYPAERLLIVESSIYPSLPSRRLPKVRYERISIAFERLTRTRFAALYSSLHFLRAPFWAKKIDGLLNGFQPGAVLTVAHSHLWLTAASFAKLRGLPLHVICHDEITKTVMHVPILEQHINRAFREVYRSASSRLCVSPYMQDDYRERFGADAQVLYPSRAANVPLYDSPPERLATLSHGLRVAFAGTINMGGHAALLRNLATSLEARGGRLLIFGPISVEAACQAGLAGSNIELRGLLQSNDLITTLRNEADALFVPMSFEPNDRQAMKTNFPSKLTDYTATGLPILIQGPEDSSAVKWARRNKRAALVVSDPSVQALRIALDLLASDAVCRQELAQEALLVGAQYFGATSAKKLLVSALTAKG